MLTRGAIEALSLSGSSDLRARYLPKLVSGEWAGTMVLTEPQAGSDLGWIRARAVPQSDGTYRLFGQKIFVTYGEHDLTTNIVHLVLARTPDAPEGVKGLSLFIVPKFLLDREGGPGERNDVRCLSLEHKLGIRASPTAVLSFGETEGAKGFLVGELNRGLEYMFIMMNAARFSVGVEGVGVSQRAYQRALEYARERVQGIELGSKSRERVPIVRHPDVRRMLMLMKSRTEAMRALYSVVALSLDLARSHPDLSQRKKSQSFADLFVPVVKGWCTETGILNASLGVQVHGGTGYVEATGAAQHLRDARITSIYEGTTGVQAADLVGRKVAKDGGDAVRAVIVDMRRVEAALLDSKDGDPLLASRLGAGVSALERAVDFIVASYATDVRRASIGAAPFLELLGVVAGGWQMGRAALASRRRLAEKAREAEFFRAKLATARFYADHVLTSAPGLAVAVVEGAEGALRIEDDQL
jgi:alkylation response protein AidB-like acyl-CoA dehydrogenase